MRLNGSREELLNNFMDVWQKRDGCTSSHRDSLFPDCVGVLFCFESTLRCPFLMFFSLSNSGTASASCAPGSAARPLSGLMEDSRSVLQERQRPGEINATSTFHCLCVKFDRKLHRFSSSINQSDRPTQEVPVAVE